METNVINERLAFVHDLESGHWSMTELCERYGVTRPTGYKWLARHQPAAAEMEPSRRGPDRDPASQSGLARRLQGAVPNW